MADTRDPMPANGWPHAPCPQYRTRHPAHGWTGAKSGITYWCGPETCQAARTIAGDPEPPPYPDPTEGGDRHE